METKKKRLVTEIGVAVVAASVLIAYVLLSQTPVTPRTPETTNPPDDGGNTSPPPSDGGETNPPPGGNNTTTPTPPPAPLGNGHIVPKGWSTASCPQVPEHSKAFGARARCEQTATWGALKKAGLASTSNPTVIASLGETASIHESASILGDLNPGKHLGWAKQVN